MKAARSAALGLALLATASAAVGQDNPYRGPANPYLGPPEAQFLPRQSELPQVEILSGETLNAWLMKLQARPDKGVSGPRLNLDGKHLAQINVTRMEGNGGLALLRKGGDLDW